MLAPHIPDLPPISAPVSPAGQGVGEAEPGKGWLMSDRFAEADEAYQERDPDGPSPYRFDPSTIVQPDAGAPRYEPGSRS